jgi:N-acetylglucosaminyldiphosphoundecaprenol N-acetyl-beta-D-mannosaminyltransferase
VISLVRDFNHLKECIASKELVLCGNPSNIANLHNDFLDKSLDLHLIADGVLFKITNPKAKNRITGMQSFNYTLENFSKKRFFFLVPNENSIHPLLEYLKHKSIENVEIEVGVQNYDKNFIENTRSLLTRINSFNPDIVFLGIGSPRQEKAAIYLYKNLPNKTNIQAVGAVFDFISGQQTRAPNALSALGLEWLWRFIHDPKRMFARIFVDVYKYLAIVLFTGWHKELR